MSDEMPPPSDSPRMREAGEWVGRWLVEIGNETCTIMLERVRVETANGWRLDDTSGCMTKLLPGAAAWRPSPEGIEIAGANRLTLLVLTATNATRADGRLPDGRPVTLTRAPASR